MSNNTDTNVQKLPFAVLGEGWLRRRPVVVPLEREARSLA